MIGAMFSAMSASILFPVPLTSGTAVVFAPTASTWVVRYLTVVCLSFFDCGMMVRADLGFREFTAHDGNALDEFREALDEEDDEGGLGSMP